jgi:site-specific recombinase, resolvase family
MISKEDTVIMKRVKAACICQTLHFLLKEDVAHDLAVKQVEQEVEQYRKNLERNHTQYKMVGQSVQPDGSIIVKVIKQYNSAPVGDYLK